MYRQQVFRFLDYLGTNPRVNDLCEHLLNDFNLAFHPEKIRITWKCADNSLSVIGEYGYEYGSDGTKEMIGRSFTYDQWNSSPTEGYDVITGRIEGPWSKEGNVFVHKITHGYLTVGFIKIVFEDLDDAMRNKFQIDTEILMGILSFYINLEMKRIHTLALTEGQDEAQTNLSLDPKTRFGLLTTRQKKIIRLIGEKKTNAQIGKELGYATTTIHAECSDIYQTLAVGNRSQAFALVAEFLD
jgi:DNA-binding CsgD family transcriptional regulator